MFPWTTGVYPWINSKYTSVICFGFCLGVFTEVPWVTWLACGFNYWCHWVKLKVSCIVKLIVEISQNHENSPDYQEHYHSQHLAYYSIDFMNISVKDWSSVWPRIDSYGSNWDWITARLLKCPTLVMTMGRIGAVGPGYGGNGTKPEVELMLEFLIFSWISLTMELLITAHPCSLRVNPDGVVLPSNHPAEVFFQVTDSRWLW